MRRESWSVESTIGLLFTIIIAILALAIEIGRAHV